MSRLYMLVMMMRTAVVIPVVMVMSFSMLVLMFMAVMVLMRVLRRALDNHIYLCAGDPAAVNPAHSQLSPNM